MHIRKEEEKDYEQVNALLKQAFEKEYEAILVKKLRKSPDFIADLSIVAELEGKVVGHILFSLIRVQEGENVFLSLALAPMAVLPSFQKQGIGQQLVKAGLARAKELGYTSVIVLGHAEYYPKFGFVPAQQWGIQAPFEVPSPVFMALELVPDALKNVRGMVVYPPEFMEE